MEERVTIKVIKSFYHDNKAWPIGTYLDVNKIAAAGYIASNKAIREDRPAPVISVPEKVEEQTHIPEKEPVKYTRKIKKEVI